jgi:hypothetical protein
MNTDPNAAKAKGKFASLINCIFANEKIKYNILDKRKVAKAHRIRSSQIVRHPAWHK